MSVHKIFSVREKDINYLEVKGVKMSQTLEGGKLAAKTNKERHGENFYREIGAIGGKKGNADGAIKGFAAMSREKRAEAGRKGGITSRRKRVTK